MALTRTHHTHLTSNHPTHHSSHTTSSHSAHHSTTHHTTCGRRGAAAGWAQYTEPPGGAAAHVCRGWLPCGRRSTQSLLAELLRAWSPLGRGWLPLGRRSNSTQSLLAELMRAWSPLGRGWLWCGRRSTQSLLHYWCARGRRWAAAGCRVAGAVRRASWMSSGLPLTPSFTHHFVKHHLSHTIFDTTSLTHTHTHHLSHTVTDHLSRTTLSHTIFDTPSLSHTIFRHTIFHTHNFVTHHLSSTSSFVFPSVPVPATTFLAHSWKKLTCGVIRSFYFSRMCVCVGKPCVAKNRSLIHAHWELPFSTCKM